MSRYSPVLVLIATSLLIGCGGGGGTGAVTITPPAIPQQQSVDLSWEPSITPVVGYNVYRGTTSGGPYTSKLSSAPQPSTHFVDTSVRTGTYYYVATSLDADFVESSYSNEVKAVVP